MYSSLSLFLIISYILSQILQKVNCFLEKMQWAKTSTTVFAHRTYDWSILHELLISFKVVPELSIQPTKQLLYILLFYSVSILE